MIHAVTHMPLSRIDLLSKASIHVLLKLLRAHSGSGLLL